MWVTNGKSFIGNLIEALLLYMNSSKKLEEREQSKIYNSLELLEEYGPQIGSSHSKKLKGFDVWELRILGSNNLRIFYASIPGRSFLLLYGIKKKSQKTPLKEIKTAQERLEKYLTKSKR